MIEAPGYEELLSIIKSSNPMGKSRAIYDVLCTINYINSLIKLKGGTEFTEQEFAKIPALELFYLLNLNGIKITAELNEDE